MRRLVEICLASLTVGLGLGLYVSGTPSGLSPLSLFEARNVVGGQSPGDSDCPEGMSLTFEESPGTGCDATCVRIPNAYYDGSSLGGEIPEYSNCPGRCGRYVMPTDTCGS